MAWESKTHQFAQDEIDQIESKSAVELATIFLNSDPIVALRGIAEVMLNGDEEKLGALLADPVLVKHWSSFIIDHEVTRADIEYAVQIDKRMKKQLSN